MAEAATLLHVSPPYPFSPNSPPVPQPLVIVPMRGKPHAQIRTNPLLHRPRLRLAPVAQSTLGPVQTKEGARCLQRSPALNHPMNLPTKRYDPYRSAIMALQERSPNHA